MIAPQKIIGQRLRKERVANGWRQRTLADKIGTTEGTINRWEQGKNAPDSYYQERLCEVFGKTPDELFGLPQSEQVISPVDQISSLIPHTDRAMQLVPLIGREEDKAKIVKYLLNKEKRLITLTGAAGVGKTRLALEVLKVIKDYSEYTSAYISLAGLEPNTPILSTIAWGLGIQTGKDAASLSRAIMPLMEEKVFVLLLDNLEHVIDFEIDGTYPNKELLTDLLIGCPRLRILATSRITLKLEYENVYKVEPLPIPSTQVQNLHDLKRYPATELFCHVAQTKVSQTSFEVTSDEASLISEICRILDGLPLAIRIVASKLPKFTIQKIHKKVLSIEMLTMPNDNYELKRQQTLLATFNWSYDLLRPEQQILFRSLAAFVGGCDYEAAEVICEKKEEDIWRLIDSCLLEIMNIDGKSRLYLLRPIYEYAKEMLRDEKEAEAIRRRHRNYYFSLVEGSENKLRGSEQIACFQQLEREWENIQVALEYTFNNNYKCENLLSFVGGLWWYWRLSMRNRLGKFGRQWLNRLFEHSEVKTLQKNPELFQKNTKLASAYAKVLFMRAAAEAATIEDVKNRDLIYKNLLQSLELYYSINHRDGYALTTVIATELGSMPDTEDRLNLAYELFDESNNFWSMAWVRLHQGCISVEKGNFEKARAFFNDSIKLYETVGDRHGVWEVEVNLTQLEQIEKIAKEGLGEWSGWPLVMNGALSARISRKSINMEIGWQAYVDPYPVDLMPGGYFSYSAKDFLESEKGYPPTYLEIFRGPYDQYNFSLMATDLYYAAFVDLLAWFPDDFDLQDWLIGENINAMSGRKEVTEDVERSGVTSLVLYPPAIYPNLYTSNEAKRIQPEDHVKCERLQILAMHYVMLDKYELAESLLLRALPIAEHYQDTFPLNMITCLIGLILVYMDQEQFDKAKPLFQPALLLILQYSDILSPHTIDSFYNLAERFLEKNG